MSRQQRAQYYLTVGTLGLVGHMPEQSETKLASGSRAGTRDRAVGLAGHVGQSGVPQQSGSRENWANPLLCQ